MTALSTAELDRLRSEIEDLSAKVHRTIAEIAQIRHPVMEDDRVLSAVDELAAIVAATEAATEDILSAAEQVGAVAEELRGSGWDGAEAFAARLDGVSTQIFEASNFQDITGQRIAKVNALLREVDARLVNMIETFGEEAFLEVQPAPAAKPTSLLNGPALANGLQQSAIDALFS